MRLSSVGFCPAGLSIVVEHEGETHELVWRLTPTEYLHAALRAMHFAVRRV